MALSPSEASLAGPGLWVHLIVAVGQHPRLSSYLTHKHLVHQTLSHFGMDLKKKKKNLKLTESHFQAFGNIISKDIHESYNPLHLTESLIISPVYSENKAQGPL